MDTIERQAAIDAIVNTVSRVGMHDNSEVARYGATFRQHEIIDIIETLPSAPRWIPVTERLPEEEIDVLCFTIHQTMLVASYGKLYPLSDEVGWITNEYNRFHVSSVLAWMPLPEPYKE